MQILFLLKVNYVIPSPMSTRGIVVFKWSKMSSKEFWTMVIMMIMHSEILNHKSLS